ANAAEGIEFAWVCRAKQLPATAARLYAAVFAAPGEDQEKLKASNRYGAACCAAWAGCGQGEDASRLDEKERTRWRAQAREWLRADLGLHAKRLESDCRADRRDVQQQMQRWRREATLAGVRDAEALARLPADERKAWRDLWAEVEALLRKARGKTKA